MIGQTINERYEVLSELGQGGMGTVYRAHDQTLNRDVAVKLMSNTRLGTEGRARLMGEAQTVAQLNHPNIVTVYDVIEYDSLPHIIMELIEGQTLRHQMPQAWDEILAVTKQIAAALHHAHQHDVIHRDVKPENVVIDSNGVAKLMDFGIAHSVSSRITSDGMIIGTVSYMSPEQAMGKRVDARSDLYSLGVMLYEFTTGETPFNDIDPIAIISQHINAPIVPARAKRDDLPAGLDAVISRLLEKDPDHRPESAKDVLAALNDPLILEAGAAPGKELSLLDRIVRGRIIGRQVEFLEARSLWSQAESGHGQLLMISGEPGIGKTRLVREIATHAEVTGGRVLFGESFAEGNPPYGAFSQIVRQVLNPASLDEHDIPDFVLADLLAIAPDLRQHFPNVPPNPSLEPESERQRLFENITTFLSILSAQSPLMVVIDDAHWSNSGTLFFIRHLARRIQNLPLLLIATYREIELLRTHPLNELLLELNRQRIGTRIKLSRLDAETTRQLLESIFSEQVSEDFSQIIYHETEGNPFFVEEVCKSLVESGALYYQNGEWHRPDLDEIEIPQSVQVAIESRLENLGEDIMEALRIAATLGREFDFNTLHHASGLDEEQIINSLEIAENAQLLAEMSGKSGGVFSFAHALIPTALTSGLSGLRQRRLHQKALLAVEDLHPNDYSSLAHHAAESGEVEKTLEYAEKAGDAAASSFAWEEAQFQYNRAIEAAEDLKLNERLSHLYESVGKAFSNQGMHLLAAENAQKAISFSTDKARNNELKAFIGSSYTFIGDERGLPLLEEARRDLNPKTQALVLANTILRIGRNHHLAGQHQKALETHMEAQKILESIDDPAVEGFMYVSNAAALQHLTQFDESDAWARKAFELGRIENVPYIMTLGLEYLSENSFATGRWQDTLDFAEKEHKIAEQIGEQNRLAWIQLNRTWAFRGLGKLSKAEQEGLEGLKLADLVSDVRASLLIQARLSYTLTDMGRFAEAEKNTSDGLINSANIDHIYIMGMSKVARAYYHIRTQEWQPALELANSINDSLIKSDALWLQQSIDPIHALALWGIGEFDLAAQLASDTYQRALISRAVGTQAEVLQIWAQVLFSQEKYDDALEKANAAFEVAQQENYRLIMGLSNYWTAKILLAQKKTSEAIKAAQEALKLFEYCGAQPDIDRTQNLLITK